MVAPEGNVALRPVQLGGEQVPPLMQMAVGLVKIEQPVHALATVLPAGQGP